MATLGFELSEQAMACAINNHGQITSVTESVDTNMVMTATGPVFGLSARTAREVQPELPGTDQLWHHLGGSQHWYQEACNRQWDAHELLQSLIAQAVAAAREVAFERQWQAVLAVEPNCKPVEAITPELLSSSECSARALVTRQSALAAYWAASVSGHSNLAAAASKTTMPRSAQTIVSIDWTPGYVHLSIFTAVGGQFKLLYVHSLADVGLKAFEMLLAQSLLTTGPHQDLEPGVVRRLWQQAIVDPTGVGKQVGWIDGQCTEWILCCEHVDQLFRPGFDKIRAELSAALAQLGLTASDADQVLLLGGPGGLLLRHLSEGLQLELPVFKLLDDPSVIARGAACLSSLSPVQLRAITDAEEALRVAIGSEASPLAQNSLSIQSCDIGLRIGHAQQGRSMIYKLIDAHAALPACRARIFRTSRINQARMILDLVFIDPVSGRIVHHETRSLQLPADLPAYTPIQVSVVRQPSGQTVVQAACVPEPPTANCNLSTTS